MCAQWSPRSKKYKPAKRRDAMWSGLNVRPLWVRRLERQRFQRRFSKRHTVRPAQVDHATYHRQEITHAHKCVSTGRISWRHEHYDACIIVEWSRDRLGWAESGLQCGLRRSTSAPSKPPAHVLITRQGNQHECLKRNWWMRRQPRTEARSVAVDSSSDAVTSERR